MKTLGIDIGSRYIKAVLLERGAWVKSSKAETSFDPLGKCREVLREMPADRAVINRVVAMVKRVPLQDEVVFAGGCAYNPCLKGLLEKSLGRNIQMAPIPEMTGALGAALLAEQSPV